MIIENGVTISKLSKDNIETFKDKAYANKTQELKNYTQIALSIIESYYDRTSKVRLKSEVKEYITEQSDFLFSIIDKQYNLYKDKLSEDALKKLIMETIAATRYGESGYFWINDFNYKMVMYPIKKELTGKNFKDDPRVPFVALGVNALKNSSKDEAIIKYSFYNPATGKTTHKISNVRLFKPWNWVIGTGAYIDDIEENIKDMQSREEDMIAETIAEILIMSIIISLLIVAVASLLVKKGIIDPINKMEDTMKRIAKERDLSIKLDGDYPKELSNIAKSFNDLIHIFKDIVNEAKLNSNENNSVSHKLSKVSLAVGSRVEESVRVVDSTKKEANEVSKRIYNSIDEAKYNKSKIIEANKLLIKSRNDLMKLVERIEYNAQSENRGISR